MRFGIPDSDSEDDLVVLDTPIKRTARSSKFGIPSDSESDYTPARNESRFSLSSDEEGAAATSSDEEEIDYEFRFIDQSLSKSSRSREEDIFDSPGPSTIVDVTLRTQSPSKPKRRVTIKRKGGLAVQEDEWERWDRLSRERVLLKSHHESMAFNNHLASTPEKIKHASFNRNNQAMTEIQSLLNSLQIERIEADQKAQSEFQARNRVLWEGIDRTIAAVQAEERKLNDQKSKEEETRRREEEQIRQRAEEQKRQELARQKIEQERKAAVQAAKEREEAEKTRKVTELRALQIKEAERQAEIDRSSAEQNALTSLQKNEQRWEKWVEHQKKTKLEVIERVKADDTLRKAIGGPKRKITRRIGQIVNTRDSIVNITQDIHQDLCSVLNRQVSAAEPVLFSRELPIAYLYLLSHISKALLHQAENEVLAKSEAAFPLAKLVTGLMLRGHAALGEILISRFVKKCPWVLPFYPARREGQNEQEYEISLGYKKGNTSEDTVQYNNRMAAIVTLYLAICAVDIKTIVPTVFPQPQNQQQLEQLIQVNFRTSILWMWTAGVCKAPLPNLETAPQLLVAAFEAIGQQLVSAYGTKQVRKLVVAIVEQGLGPEGTNQGLLAAKALASRQQLRLVCEPFLTNGQFPDVAAKSWQE